MATAGPLADNSTMEVMSMVRNKAEQIANFRYQLISPIICRESLYFGKTSELIREAAGKIYQIPGSRKTRGSPRTIERYLKKYRAGVRIRFAIPPINLIYSSKRPSLK